MGTAGQRSVKVYLRHGSGLLRETKRIIFSSAPIVAVSFALWIMEIAGKRSILDFPRHKSRLLPLILPGIFLPPYDSVTMVQGHMIVESIAVLDQQYNKAGGSGSAVGRCAIIKYSAAI